MEELIVKVAEGAGITQEQAKKAIEAVKDFVVGKYPLLEGVVKNVFSQN
jgi:hypothetical protein